MSRLRFPRSGRMTLPLLAPATDSHDFLCKPYFVCAVLSEKRKQQKDFAGKSFVYLHYPPHCHWCLASPRNAHDDPFA